MGDAGPKGVTYWIPRGGGLPQFGLDRTVGSVFALDRPLPRRSLLRRLGDAWRAAVSAFRWGPG